MHNLQAERFYKLELVNAMMMAHDGAIKTFPLRGIKDSPPYPKCNWNTPRWC